MQETSNNSNLPELLHIALWNGNYEQIEAILQEDETSKEKRDRYGNRALHMALQFAHRNIEDIIQLLLEHNARVRSKDLTGWRTVHHCIVTNNEKILSDLIRKEAEQMPKLITEKVQLAADKISDLPDFYAEIHFDIHSWVPILSRLLPKDTIRIWKKKNKLRFDLTLVGFENFSWQRGNLSMLLLGEEFLSIDHEKKVCKNWFKETILKEEDVLESVHLLMSNKMMSTTFAFDKVKFVPKQHWLSSSTYTEDVSKWQNANVYEVSDISMDVLVRPPQQPHHQSINTSSEITDIFDQMKQEKKAVTIYPGGEHVIPVEVTKGETICWIFQTKKFDLNFELIFYPDDLTEKDENASNGSLEGKQTVVSMKRVKCFQQQQEGKFTASDASGTLLFKWDNSYSFLRHKQLEVSIYPEILMNMNSGDSSPEENKLTGQAEEENNHKCDAESINLELNLGKSLKGRNKKNNTVVEMVTFQEWFGFEIDQLPDRMTTIPIKPSIAVYRQPNAKKYNKKIAATVSMSSDFPLTTEQFLPVVEVLSKTSQHFENVKDFLNSKLPPGFPVKFNIPIVPSVSSTVSFLEMKLETPEDHIFQIPSDYEGVTPKMTPVQPSKRFLSLSDNYISN